ncbi:MAG: hypothetical protein Q9183_006221, partial [Haloplaca sp. 2 TL-2023]
MYLPSLISIHLLLLLPLLALSHPVATKFATADNKTTQHTRTPFRLKSHVLNSPNPDLENLYLNPYHIYPTFNYATLSPKTAKRPGIKGFLNGTDFELENQQGRMDFKGG